MEFKDYYQILGISHSASEAEIKESYKKLAKKFHPDTSTGSEEKFKEINEAYEALKTHERRSKYDAMFKYRNNFDTILKKQGSHYDEQKRNEQRQRWNDIKQTIRFAEDALDKKQAPPPNKKPQKEAKFSDFFEMIFGKQQEEQQKKKTEQTKQSPQRGEDFEMDLQLSLEDAYSGTLRKIEISGTSRGLRRLEVSIPAGVREGNKIKIRNEGKPGKNGGPPGDLFLKVKFKEHPLYQIENDDVHSELELRPEEALLGNTKYITTLEGVLELVVPPKTQTGRILRLKSKGLYNSKEDRYGDHYVHTTIKIPDDLSEKEEELYQELLEISRERDDENQ